MPDSRFTDESLDEKMPIEDAGAPHGDPFHYGKKKYYDGYKDGAYATSNVPAGNDRHNADTASKAVLRKEKRRHGKKVILKGGAVVMPPVKGRRRGTFSKFR